MIPRVFVSSTYYDLKHVRERIEKFIDSYGFEPILFESDKVTYQHGKEIDYSAYYEVGLCHIMVLIVGGRYGSPSSQNKQEEERKKYDEDFISITRKEFETAIQKNIPILIFIDKNVNSEYQTYKENQEYFDDLYSIKSKNNIDIKKFKFAHVDHINVFKFIDIIRSKPIKTFEKVEEIEAYIKSQLSGMFYLYLESLKRRTEDRKILDTISELNNVTLRMNEMLSSVGKEILGKDKDEYEKVIESQLAIMIEFFGELFNSSIKFVNTVDIQVLSDENLHKLSKIIYEDIFEANFPSEYKRGASLEDNIKANRETNLRVFTELKTKMALVDKNIALDYIDFRKLSKDFHEKVLPFIKNERDKIIVLNKIRNIIYYKLDDTLPF